MSIGENIKACRKAAGLTQRQVGDKLGVTESAVGQFEKANANPGVYALVRLAEAIGCDVQEFFDRNTTGDCMYNIDTLKKQHNVERLAREAEKVLGITHALNLALTECKEANIEDIAGAFDAMEDIARDLAKDLSEIVDEMGEES